jgi:hypothetical protein
MNILNKKKNAVEKKRGKDGLKNSKLKKESGNRHTCTHELALFDHIDKLGK